MPFTTMLWARSRIIALAFLPLACSGAGSETESNEDAGESKPITESGLGETMEARRFFAAPGTSVWSEDIPLSDLKGIVEDLYAAGAAEVLFGDIGTLGDQRVSAWLVVRLPADTEPRAAVFEAFNKVIVERLGEEAEKDRGQRFIGMALD